VDIAAARLATLNSTVTVRGIITNGSELGTIRYIQDTTAGISLYDASLSNVHRGDSIVATGVLTDYNNLLEINPVTSFTVITTGNTLPAPVLLTPSQLGESSESELVEINNVVFANAGSPIAGNSSYNFTVNSQTASIYVKTGSPLVGVIIPTGTVTLKGIESQFLTDYQVLPRDTNDLVPNSSISIITALTQSNITTTGFQLDYNTNITGSTYILYGKTPALELGMLSGASGTSHTVTISGANPADIFYVKAFSVNGLDTATTPVRVFATVSNSSGTIKVYFDKSVDTTLSTGTNAIYLSHAIDDTIIAYINRAKFTIDVAMYSFDNTGMSDISTALNNAQARGVKVRVIQDGSTTNQGLTELNASIPYILSPQTSAYTIMHNKFMIIDAHSANAMDPVLWTGSTNWTNEQTSTDANNVIIFQDQSIAKGYTLEFNEMWGDTGMVTNPSVSRFGQFKTDNTPHEYRINGIRVEQYFSPSDGTNGKIMNAMATANTDLYVETMEITRSDLAYGITNAAAAGINTYVLVNDTSSTTTWPILRSGLPTGHLAYYHATGIMHHKYMIVDPSNISSDPMVETGTHNWTNSAETKNDENIVIVHNAVIANIYLQEFVPRFTQNGGVMSVTETASTFADLSVFPNPTNAFCFIHYTLPQADMITLSVTDLSGQTISTQQINSTQGENNFEWNSNGLSKGIYMLTLRGTNSFAVCKVIVQ